MCAIIDNDVVHEAFGDMEDRSRHQVPGVA